VHRDDDMRAKLLSILLVLTVGCSGNGSDPGAGIGSGSGSGDGSGMGSGSDTGSGSGSGTGSGSGSGSGSGAVTVPDVQCTGAPDAGPAGDFNHLSSELISALGSPMHRGIDLIAPAEADTQKIEGDISYTIADKALEDEDVDVLACLTESWTKIGTARTDGEGHFALSLTGDARLPIGMRDMYVSVVGDRTGTNFLAYVAPGGAQLMVSDVDGTLTDSENAFTTSLVTGATVGVQPGAPDAYVAAEARGLQLVYLTARGNQFTGDTRDWLTANGFPRGPLRLATSFVTLPGSDTVAFKTGVLQTLETNFDVVAGVGNRDSDIMAYTNAPVAADHIFIKLPEYQSECQADLDAGKAIGFMSYSDLQAQQIPNL
jgi:hypothetical protein